jgi:hypothetical protein
MSIDIGNIFPADTEFDLNSQDNPLAVTNPMGLVPDTPLAPTTPAATPMPGMGSLTSTYNAIVPTTNGSAGGSIASKLQKAIFGIDLEDGLFIVIGLLLIAAGLYGFDTVRDTVNQSARLATEAAAA